MKLLQQALLPMSRYLAASKNHLGLWNLNRGIGDSLRLGGDDIFSGNFQVNM